MRIGEGEYACKKCPACSGYCLYVKEWASAHKQEHGCNAESLVICCDYNPTEVLNDEQSWSFLYVEVLKDLP